jgi:hypothetical protein
LGERALIENCCRSSAWLRYASPKMEWRSRRLCVARGHAPDRCRVLSNADPRHIPKIGRVEIREDIDRIHGA